MQPLVSAIMPACYGEMASVAIKCFLDQTYENLELVVLDNNVEGQEIENLLPNDTRIKYSRCARAPLGKLRNDGNRIATGEIIVNWDADDWYAPNRIESQVKRLKDSGKAVTGWHTLNYYDTEGFGTYKYRYEARGNPHPPYSMGTSQCYLKSWWEKHPYPETGVEDWPFTQEARNFQQLDSCDVGHLCVARAHHDSIFPIRHLVGHAQFPAVERSEFPQEFFDSIKALKS
jgi:glycosyltransferase involved in cell wall biosynthesis